MKAGKSTKIKIGIAQVSPKLGLVDDNFLIYEKYISSAIEQKLDVIQFPELSLTGYFLKDMVPEVAQTADSPVVKKLGKLSREISIIAGIVEESDDSRFFNSSFYFEDGEIKGIHRKVYLPTYGLFDEQRYFAKGEKIRAFNTKFGRCAMLVCEDMWHPSASYIASQDGAKVIFALSASPARGIGHGEKPESAVNWEIINESCARYNSVYVAFSNRVGVEDGVTFWGGSEIISPFGDREIKGDYFNEGLFAAEIDFERLKSYRVSSPLYRDEDISLTYRELERIIQERKDED